MDRQGNRQALITDPDSHLGWRVAEHLSAKGWAAVGLDAELAPERLSRVVSDADVVIDLGHGPGIPPDPAAAARRTAVLAESAAYGAPSRYVLLAPLPQPDAAPLPDDAEAAIRAHAGSLEAVVVRAPFVHGRAVPAALALIRRYLAEEVAPAGPQPVQWIHVDDLAEALAAAATRPAFEARDLTVADPFAVPETVVEQELARLDRLLTDTAGPDDQVRPDYPLLPPVLDTRPAVEALGVAPRRDFWVSLAQMVQAIRSEGRRPVGGPAATPALALARGETPAAGQTVVITGATAGIGRATALELARLGAEIVAVGRNAEAGQNLAAQVAADGRGACRFFPADLSLMAEVRRLAAGIGSQHPRIDVLINGAAMMCAGRDSTAEGHERMWATNHLAPFLLTNLLMDRLRAAPEPRVLNVSCEAHRRAAPEFGMPHAAPSAFDAYCHSKLAGVMFTYALARRVEDDGFAVLAVHPGEVATGLASRDGALPAELLARFEERSIPVGAAARHLVTLAIAPRYRCVKGKYFLKSAEAPSADISYDIGTGEELWRASAETVGLH